MQGQTMIVTGGTSGMGKRSAAQLAQTGATLLLIGRNRDKGEAAAEEIRRISGNTAVTFLQADLSLMRDVRRVSEHIRDEFARVDVLVHGAGGSFPKQRIVTDEGLEFCFAVQYLARFVLTNELVGLLCDAPDPQVLSIAGGAWGAEKLDFADLQSEKSYGKFEAIGKCAALNYLLTLEQIDQYSEITFYNLNPGLVRTATVTGDSQIVRLFFNTAGRLFSRPPGPAADEIVALLEGDYPAGFYKASLTPQTPAGTEADAEASENLWAYSQQLVADLLAEDVQISTDQELVSA